MKGTSMMKRTSLATLILAVIGTTACERGTGPASDDLTSPRATLLTADQQATLDAQLQAEKDRIAKTAAANGPVYDAAVAEWQQLKQTWTANSGLFFCDPVRYAGVAKIVGPEGATFEFGPHKLVIPAGALLDYRVITAEVPSSLLVEAKFSPHGTKFLVQPKLTLNYRHCTKGTDKLKSIAYLDESKNVLEYPTTVDVRPNGLADAWIWHFSTYSMVMN
jgi:hypothetical protein